MNFVRSHLKTLLLLGGAIVVGYFLLRRPTEEVIVSHPVGPTQVGATQAVAPSAEAQRTLEIVTLLPRDAIPAIDNPRFYSAVEADAEYAPDELVLGVSLDGDSRAYSTALLSGHEIVNDTVGGRKIAVTW